MIEDKAQDVVVGDNETANQPPKKKGSFAVGHPKYGGRRKKEKVSHRMWQSREIAEELDFHPLIEAIKIYRTGRLPSAPGVKAMPVSATSRVRCLEQALAFLLPRLSHQGISGPDNGPMQMQVAEFDVTRLMMDPALASAAQTLALGLSTSQREAAKQIEAGTWDAGADGK